MVSDLDARYQAIQREMVELFERTAARENHWLMYFLLGWEHLAACILSFYLVEIAGIQERWPYVALWLVQIAVAVATIKLVTGRPQGEESPLEPLNKRVWLMFLFLCINVAVLNVLAGQPIFTFLPTLAVLSSLAFTAMTVLMSRKFMWAGVAMFLTGIVMASYPKYAFVSYGVGWLVVLHVLSVIYLWKRRRWLGAPTTAAPEGENAAPPVLRLVRTGH